jgi:hypothetical protein
MKARTTSERRALSREITKAGRNFAPERSLNGKRVKTMLPKSYIPVPDVALAIEVRLVRKEGECTALFGDPGKRHVVVQRFKDDAYPLARRDTSALNFGGNLPSFDTIKDITHETILAL